MQNNFGKYTRRVSAMSMTLLLLLCGCAGTPTGEPLAETERRHYSTSSDAGRKRETLSPDWLDGVIPDAPSTLPGVSLTLPAVTTEYAPFLAVGALTLCSGHTAEKTAALLSGAGFDIVAQHGYDKSAADPAHTCAWTLASRERIYGGAPRTLFAVVVRGTEGGEWYSNFDFAPSHSDDATFAENFLFAAEDVLAGIEGVTPHYLIVVDNETGLDRMTVNVELKPEAFSDSFEVMDNFRQMVAEKLKGTLLVGVKVKLVEPGGIERSTGKTKHVKDLRK